MSDQPHSTPTSELPRSPRVQRLLDDTEVLPPALAWERDGTGEAHRHPDSEGTEYHYDGHLPHTHDSGIVVWLDPATHQPLNHQPIDRTAALVDEAKRRVAAEVERLNVPADPGDVAPAFSQPGAPADPTPVVHPALDAAHPPRDGRAGAGRPTSLVRDDRGRFTPRPTIPPMSADLAQALIDADAEAWKVDTTLRTVGVLVFAVEFDDRVRHGGGAA